MFPSPACGGLKADAVVLLWHWIPTPTGSLPHKCSLEKASVINSLSVKAFSIAHSSMCGTESQFHTGLALLISSVVIWSEKNADDHQMFWGICLFNQAKHLRCVAFSRRSGDDVRGCEPIREWDTYTASFVPGSLYLNPPCLIHPQPSSFSHRPCIWDWTSNVPRT